MMRRGHRVAARTRHVSLASVVRRNGNLLLRPPIKTPQRIRVTFDPDLDFQCRRPMVTASDVN